MVATLSEAGAACAERLVNKLKQFHRIPMHYDKLARRFLAINHLTTPFIITRGFVNTT